MRSRGLIPAKNEISQRDRNFLTRNSFLESKPFECCRDIIGHSRKGVYGKVNFNNGLSLYFVNIRTNDLAEKTTVKTVECSGCGFRFCISGYKKLILPSLKNEIIIKPDQCGMFHLPEEIYSHKFRSDDTLQLVYILMEPDFFTSLAEESVKLPVPMINPSSGKYGEAPFNSSRVMTPEMHICLHRMINCPYFGPARKFYFEAKTMELIAHNLEQLQSANRKKNIPLKSMDIERMRYAGELLMQHCENPPGITDLVKKLGTSRTKFFNEFRQVHGVSPTAYLRCARMEKAKDLLNNDSMSIAEIADQLGFSSASHFSTAFKQYYGISPGLCR